MLQQRSFALDLYGSTVAVAVAVTVAVAVAVAVTTAASNKIDDEPESLSCSQEDERVQIMKNRNVQERTIL